MGVRHCLEQWKAKHLRRKARPPPSLHTAGANQLSPGPSNDGPSTAYDVPTYTNSPITSYTDIAAKELEPRGSKAHSSNGDAPTSSTAGDAAGDLELSKSLQDQKVTIGNLWNQAYQELRADNEKLVNEYEKILAKSLRTRNAFQTLLSASVLPGSVIAAPGLNASSTAKASDAADTDMVSVLAKVGTPQRNDQMRALLEDKIEEDKQAMWKLQLGEHTVVVRDQIDKVVKVVAFAKDFIAQAVASEPHATLAWAGICTLLPVSTDVVLGL